MSSTTDRDTEVLISDVAPVTRVQDGPVRSALSCAGSRHVSTLAEEAEKNGVRDERLLEAICRVRRVQFVPAEHKELAEHDVPIPIGHHQVTTQPSLVAAMIEAVAPEPQASTY